MARPRVLVSFLSLDRTSPQKMTILTGEKDQSMGIEHWFNHLKWRRLLSTGIVPYSILGYTDTLWDPHVAAYVSYPLVIKRRIFNCHVWLPWEILNHLISYLWITAFSASRNKRKPIEKVHEIVIFDFRIPSDWLLLYQLYMILFFVILYQLVSYNKHNTVIIPSDLLQNSLPPQYLMKDPMRTSLPKCFVVSPCLIGWIHIIDIPLINQNHW